MLKLLLKDLSIIHFKPLPLFLNLSGKKKPLGKCNLNFIIGATVQLKTKKLYKTF